MNDSVQKHIPRKASGMLSHPLMCWDIASCRLVEKSTVPAIEKLQELMTKHSWDIDLAPIHEKAFDALVVTDAHQKIIWVSHGFKSMTGYSPTHVLHKKPSFLQGKNTSSATRKQIHDAISRHEPVEATIINYRKDGSEYQCHVEIIPLFNRFKKLTHFLAIERAVL